MSYSPCNGIPEADAETERVAKGVTNPFETSFKPLIDEMNAAKAELDRRCDAAGRECELWSALLGGNWRADWRRSAV